jgi:UDP-N-acetylmuramoyl-tripeptide--D-alanyl-D-alanine ligase
MFFPFELTLFSLSFVAVWYIRILYYAYLWQRKEYRGDKMLDWLSYSEGKRAVFDKWFQWRLAILLLLIITSIIVPQFKLILWLSYVSWPIELIWHAIKIKKNQILFPSFTSKLKITSVLIVLSTIFWLTIWKDFDTLQWEIWFNVLHLTTPILIGYCLLVLFPLDAYVKDALFRKAQKHRTSLKNLKVVALSGSFGKTTIKEYIAHILDGEMNVAKTEKNQNSNVSCARRTLQLTTKDDVFLCELGAYKRGDGAEICKFIQPTIAVVSGMNNQHFGLFGSEENIILAESEAISFLNEGQAVVINYTSPLNRQVALPPHLNIQRFTTSTKPDTHIELTATDIKTSLEGSTFTLWTEGTSLKVKTNQFSIGNIENIVAAIATCKSLGMSMKSILSKVEHLPFVQGRLELYDRSYGKQLFNAYNNIDGNKNILDLAAQTNKDIIVIVDDISELGNQARQTHEELAQAIAKIKPTLVYAIGRSHGSTIQHVLIQEGYPSELIKLGVSAKTVQKELSDKQNVLVLNLGYQTKNYLF